ncbi:hypothetical protein TEA_010346 [Camellia sinensis var. sinensis]|uniref:GDSL esterase/lipase n=1 Tax=Camellia sinensis var. sinensis TaxID=542762 RepID=A0A4S4DKE0_CAMSN|nr:hypothetical protein TEA_010346 [Camellia sinensis var. sinensis]
MRMVAVVTMVVVVLLVVATPMFAEAINVYQLRQLAAKKNVTCVLVFGDSSVDPGNNNRLKEALKSNFPPYGKDFFNGHPTGRFSDGRLATDFIAEAFGYTNIIRGFLDPTIQKVDLLHGVSFASAGSGYDDLTANFTGMHRLGARRVAVVGVPPFGCMPLVKTLRDKTNCDGMSNEVAFLFNNNIKQTLETLKASLGIETAYIDIYNVIATAIKYPNIYGFKETSKGCCGSGLIEFGDSCKGMSTCADPTEYVFWDAVHPTQKMYKIAADEALDSISKKIVRLTELFFKCGWKVAVAQLGHSQETEVFLNPPPYFIPSSMVDYANAIQQKFLQAEEGDASQEPDNNAQLGRQSISPTPVVSIPLACCV